MLLTMSITNDEIMRELEQQRESINDLTLAVFGDKKMGVKSLNEQLTEIRKIVQEFATWKRSFTDRITGARMVIVIALTLLGLSSVSNIGDFLLSLFNGVP